MTQTAAIAAIAASEIVETVPSALIVLDKNLIITSANRAFYQTFRTSQSETEGSLIYDLGNRQWDIPALRTLLESVIPHRASVEGFEVEHDFLSIGRRTMLVNARKIFSPGDHDGSILLAIEDVSEERLARKESQRARQLIQSIVDTIRDPLVVLESDLTVVTASKAFLTMFEITQAQAYGRRVSELEHFPVCVNRRDSQGGLDEGIWPGDSNPEASDGEAVFAGYPRARGCKG